MNELIVFLTLVFVAYIFMSDGIMSRIVSNNRYSAPHPPLPGISIQVNITLAE